jgi:hypothetical protein
MCHGRPTGRTKGAPEDKLRPATHGFAADTLRVVGARANPRVKPKDMARA